MQQQRSIEVAAGHNLAAVLTPDKCWLLRGVRLVSANQHEQVWWHTLPQIHVHAFDLSQAPQYLK